MNQKPVFRTSGVPVSGAMATDKSRRDETRILSPQQWRSGIAAWLGWFFDGLDMHLYTLVATPFVAQLLAVGQRDDQVAYFGSIIQAAFLVGWALGGGLFGRIGDRLGRARALNLTILTYACFTGLSFLAETWWQLLLCRFLAALGIGGEWAVGAALVSETWPRRWRPWIAAGLQSAVNIGVMFAMVAGYILAPLPSRAVFLVGILPALLVLWIRRAVPETEEWLQAKSRVTSRPPGIVDLFHGEVARTTVLVILVCGLSLSGHWAFLYWFPQHLWNHHDLATWSDGDRQRLASVVMILVMVGSIVGNFLAGLIARLVGYRRALFWMFSFYFIVMSGTYAAPHGRLVLIGGLGLLGIAQGAFALFTMYLPPLFPTLLRTTGAGFCYNIGRIAAALGTVFFGLFSRVGDHRLALLYASILFVPAGVIALFLPEAPGGSKEL